MDMVVLEVSYSEKDQAKQMGAKWNMDLKKWVCDEKNDSCINVFEPVYIDIKYEHKDMAKSRGAKWNVQKKKWCIPKYRVIVFKDL